MTSYETWSKEDLIRRIKELEGEAKHSVPAPASLKARHPPRPFNFSQHPRRKIALKFCYFGWEYNGLAYQNEPTPLPTVEGALLDALIETRLIDSAGGMEGCGWSRCGRTDKGVSAAGQVVALYVRSTQTDTRESNAREEAVSPATVITQDDQHSPDLLTQEPPEPPPQPLTTPRPEINYVDVLNRVLPRGIRILAWSPVAEDFDARFSCSFRHYKYFLDPSSLDLERMKDAIRRLEGEHDFRNLCKVDPSKQIVNHRRAISRATISPVDTSPELQVVDITGNGFLYHQVRHIVAILLLIGGGFESPSLVSALINTDRDSPIPAPFDGEAAPPIVDRKPEYQMADGLPLVLWDCGYREGDVAWRCEAASLGKASGRSDMRDASTGPTGLINHLRSVHQKTVVEATIQRHFLLAAEKHAGGVSLMSDTFHRGGRKGMSIHQIPLGGGTFRRIGKYIPVLERERHDTVEVVNARWLATKGAKRAHKLDTKTSEVQTIADQSIIDEER